jgi:hypothetical protein
MRPNQKKRQKPKEFNVLVEVLGDNLPWQKIFHLLLLLLICQIFLLRMYSGYGNNSNYLNAIGDQHRVAVHDVVIVGLGNVGRNLLSILEQKKEVLAKEYGIAFRIVAAVDSSGLAVCPQGFNLQELHHYKSIPGNKLAL